jgi:hypothetical protein
MESISRGVLDRPVKPGDDKFLRGESARLLLKFYLIGGAYWMPPALQSWLRPRGILSLDSDPTLRS